MVQIDFPDKDIICNLVSVFSLQPDILCIVYDKKLFSEKSLMNYKEAVCGHERFLEVKEYACDSGDIESINGTLEQIADEHRGEKIYVNLSGGPELMAACAFAKGKSGGLCPMYLDFDKQLLYGVYDKDVKFRTKSITMQDYVNVKGARHYSDSRLRPAEDEYGKICRMAEYIFSSLEEWQLLQKYLSSYFYGYTGLHFSVRNLHCGKEHMHGIEKLLDKFCELGFMGRRDDDRYVINNPKFREYLTNYGVWLEMYIYIKAKMCFGEAHIGFIIDWDRHDSSDTDDNEFDVVLIYKNRPVFISCKMTKPTTKDLTEIGYLARLLGGENAISILATTYPVYRTADNATGLYNRMKKLKIGLIETESFKKKSMEEVFIEAIEFPNA